MLIGMEKQFCLTGANLMNKIPRISPVQLAFLAVVSAIMFPYTFLPILNAPPANQDVWIVLLLSFVFMIIMNFPMLFFANKFMGININDTFEIITGKIGGKIVSSCFVLLSVFCFISCMVITAIFINIYILPETPVWGSLIFILLPITYGIYKGAGTIGRLSTFILPFILLTIIFFTLMGIPQMKLSALTPILADSKLTDIVKGAFFTAARYSEVTIIFVFSFYLKKTKSINKAYFGGLILFGIAMMLILMPTLLLLGEGLAKLSNNPYYMYTRQVGGFDFIQRVQSFNILAWFMGTIIKLMIYGYMATYIFAGIIKKKTQKFYIVPLAIIAFFACQLKIYNKSSTISFISSDRFFPWVVAFITFVIPTIVFIIYIIRKKKINEILTEKREEKESAEKTSNLT